MVDVEEIRKYWEVPAIAYFFSLFKTAFGLTDFDIEELEEALVTSATPEGSFLIESMVSQLLKGIYGRNIAKENQQKCLQNLLSEHFAGQGKTNPLESCVFMELPMHHKIPALYQLCHLRCDGNDVGDVLKGYEGDDLRVLPLGQDASGAQYWYYFGVQLYKEDPEPEPAPEEKKSRPQKKKKHFIFKAKKKKGRKKNAKKKGKEETKEDEEAEKPPEVPPPPPAPTRWHLVCSTLEDWEKLAESLKGSKNRQEKALYKVIMQDFLPEIPTIIQEKEKERRRRLMELEPRRVSSRLEIKKQQQEEQMKVLIEEEERQRSEESAYRRKVLEEQRKEWQRQEREAREKARYEREMAREDRARRAHLREERLALIAEGKEIPAELYYDGNSRSSEKLSEDTLSRMYQVLDAVRAHKDAWPFLQPVTEDIAPNYYEVIKRPMDLSTISEKLEMEAYNSENHFFADFKQIFSNCKRYNGVQSDVGQIGARLKKYFDKCVRRYMPSEEDANSEDEYHTFTRVAAASTSSRPRRQASTKALQTMHQSEDSEDDWYEPPPVPRRTSGRELDLRHQVEDVRRARQKLPPNVAYSVLNKSGQPAKLAHSSNGLHMSLSSLGLSSGGSVQEVLSAESNQRKVVLSAEDFKRLVQSGKMKVVNTDTGLRVQLKDGVQLTEKVVEPPPLLPGPTEIPSREDSTGPDLPPTLTIQKPATTSTVVPIPRVLNVSSPSSLTSPIPGLSRIVYPNLAANRINGARGRYPQGTVANRPAKKRKVYDPPDDDDEDEVYIPPPPRKFRKVYDPSPMDTKDLPSKHTGSSPGQEGLVDPFESKRTWGGSRKRMTVADWNKTAGTDWDSAKDSQPADNQRPFGNLPSVKKEEPGSDASLSVEPGPSQQPLPQHSSADTEAKRAFGFDSVAWGARSLARTNDNNNRNGDGRQEEPMEDEEEDEEEEEEDEQEEEAEQEEEDELEEEEQEEEEEEEEQRESTQDSRSQSSCEGQSEHSGDASLREEPEQQQVLGQERSQEESNEEDSLDSQSQHDSVSQDPVSDNSSDQDSSLPSLHGQNSSEAGVSSYTNHSVNAGHHGRSVFSMMGSVPTAPLPMMDNGPNVTATQKTEVQRPVASQGVTVSYDQQSGNQSRQVEPILERFQYF